MMRVACVTGRFQPVHVQHVELFLRALDEADRLIVAITNPTAATYKHADSSLHRNRLDANPFDVATRTILLDAALTEAGIRDMARIVTFDIFAPDTWAQTVPLDTTQVVRVFSPWEEEKVTRFTAAGYPVRRIAGDAANKVTASAIRESLFSGRDDWQEHVPVACRDLLRKAVS